MQQGIFKKYKLLYISILLGGTVWLGNVITTNADGAIATNQPGSVDDPIITKSYFDQQINQKINDALAKLSGTIMATPVPALPTPLPPPKMGEKGPESDETTNLTVVLLQPGKTIYAGAGTEFIVRSGKTIAVSNDDNGIPDVTAGKDIAAGTAVENNHLLIFPREGRGLKPDPKNVGDIYIMVRGGYIIP